MAERSRRLVPRLSQVVAEREYQLVTQSGEIRKVHLRFGKPRPLPEGAGYHCVYQIDGLDDDGPPRTAWAGGVDSLQALDLAMKMALVWLVENRAYGQGRLTWDGAHDLGLPAIEQIQGHIKRDRDPRRESEEVLAELAALREHARQQRHAPGKPSTPRKPAAPRKPPARKPAAPRKPARKRR